MKAYEIRYRDKNGDAEDLVIHAKDLEDALVKFKRSYGIVFSEIVGICEF